METGVLREPTATRSPRPNDRLAGCLYLLVFVTGGFALLSPTGRGAANLIASVCYIAVTLLFYGLFKPAGRNLSLLAAVVSLVGCVFGALISFDRAPFRVSPLVFFGFYCLLIGYLILRSTFLPRVLGALMVFGGLGWLTFASPALAKSLYPWNLAPGIIGEGALTLWLLVKGVDVPRWRKQLEAAQPTSTG
jgi:hypothetical protein